MNGSKIFLTTACFLAICFGQFSCDSTPKNNSIQTPETYTQTIEKLIQQTQEFNVDQNSSEFIHFYDSVNTYLKSVPDTVKVKRFLRGDFLRKMKYLGVYDEAINQAKQIIREINEPTLNTSISLVNLFIGQLSGLYGSLNMPDSSIFYKRLAISNSEKHTNPLFQTGPLNNMGMYMLRENKRDSAIYYFRRAEQILNNAQPLDQFWENFRHSVTDNIATYYEEIGDFEKTISIYKENYIFFDTPKELNRKVNAAISLANAHIETEEYEKAKEWLIRIQSNQNYNLADNQNPNSTYLHQTWVKYYTVKKDYKNALIQEQIVSDLTQKSVREKETRSAKYRWQLTQFSRERFNQKIKAEQAIYAKETQNKELRLWILIFIIVGGISIFFAIWTKLKNEKKFEIQKSKQLIQEKELLNLELNFKKKDLIDIALNMTQKKEWAKGIQDRLKRIQNSKGNKRSAEFKQLNDHVRNQLLMEKELTLFNENLETLNTEYYAKLKSKFPNLTKSETQLCSFIKLNLTNAQISQLKNIDPNSVIIMRYRLKKKLHLTTNQNLDEFVQNF